MRVWSYVVVVLLALWVPVSAAGEYGGTDPAGDVQYHDPNAGPVPAARDHPVEQEAPPDVAGGRGKESPAPPWMVVVGALALAALRRRGG